ncbi:MAG: amylo-alpha-1,6-glucosidase, partial [Acidimicrobiia bacterium]|nr:amylo-alpha-1,6-glucosidase [Acidimicrobiia bacterium]
MAEPWTYAGEVRRLGGADGTVTLVEGASFCLSGTNGDIVPGGAHGLYFLDTRFLSRLELRVDGAPVEPLGRSNDDPFAAVFFGRCPPPPGAADSSLVVFRTRHVGRGLLERVELRNHAVEPRRAVVELDLDVDFADLFEVKEGRASSWGRRRQHLLARGAESAEAQPCALGIEAEADGHRRGITVTFSEPLGQARGLARWELELAAGASWSVGLDVVAAVEGVEVEPRYRLGRPVQVATPSRRLAAWRSSVPVVD